MALDYVSTDVSAGFGDSRLHSGRIIRLCPAGPVLRTCVQYLITFCSRPEEASDVIPSRFVGPADLDKRVKSNDPSLNRSREIPPEAVGGGILDCFSLITSYVFKTHSHLSRQTSMGSHHKIQLDATTIPRRVTTINVITTMLTTDHTIVLDLRSFICVFGGGCILLFTAYSQPMGPKCALFTFWSTSNRKAEIWKADFFTPPPFGRGWWGTCGSGVSPFDSSSAVPISSLLTPK